MPEVRLDMDGEKSDRKKEEFVAEIVGNRGIIALEYSALLIFNGGARILRAIASYTEVHLSPSYSLFNLKALSVVIAGNVALGEKLLPVVDISDCCGR
jgi:hypothetical protein